MGVNLGFNKSSSKSSSHSETAVVTQYKEKKVEMYYNNQQKQDKLKQYIM